MKKIALFPGSFDPFTNGHLDLVRRGVGLFDELVIAIGTNSSKQRYLPLDWMLTQLEALFADEPRVSVRPYQGLTADFARRTGARYLLRGLRNTLDFEYENGIGQANRQLNPELETCAAADFARAGGHQQHHRARRAPLRGRRLFLRALRPTPGGLASRAPRPTPSHKKSRSQCSEAAYQLLES